MRFRSKVSFSLHSLYFSANQFSLSTARTDEQLEHAVRQKFSVFGTVYVKLRRDSKGMPFAFCQYEVCRSLSHSFRIPLTDLASF